jgi:aminoglycoside phosphotransferase (APT) family kinase protein
VVPSPQTKLGGHMEEALANVVAGFYPDASGVVIENFGPMPGGFSRETYSFDAVISTGGAEVRQALLLRKDPPAAVALLETSRAVEHDLIEAVRAHTKIPVSQSLGPVMDKAIFGECAMVLERAPGNGATSDLFHDGPDTDQVDDVVRHLCETLVELHQTDIAVLDPDGALADPRGAGVDPSTWDSYMDTTFEYFVESYSDMDFDPGLMVLLDAALTLRRTRPRPLDLCLVHGDFNPANFLYADGKVTALIDWENSRIGDPREDLGWMMTMDILSNTTVMSQPADEGGFLAYYNKLTGAAITEAELGWFTLFGTMNIAVPVNAAIKRRVLKQHTELLHLYLVPASASALPSIASLLNYPGVEL